MPSTTNAVRGAAARLSWADVLLLVLSVIAVLGVVLTQLAWIIVFDSTGLDRMFPELVMTVFGPSATVALVPAAYAHARLDDRLAVAAGGLVFLAALALSSVTVGLYSMCGAC